MPARIRADRDEVRRLHEAGLGAPAIAERLEVSHSTICRALNRLGLERPDHGRPLPEARRARLEAMLDEGLSFSEIHRTEGAAMSTLRAHFPGREWDLETRVEYLRTRRLWDDVDAAPYATQTQEYARADGYNRMTSGQRHRAASRVARVA